MSLFKIYIKPSMVSFEIQEIYSPVSFNGQTIFTFSFVRIRNGFVFMAFLKCAISNDKQQHPLWMILKWNQMLTKRFDRNWIHADFAFTLQYKKVLAFVDWLYTCNFPPYLITQITTSSVLTHYGFCPIKTSNEKPPPVSSAIIPKLYCCSICLERSDGKNIDI